MEIGSISFLNLNTVGSGVLKQRSVSTLRTDEDERERNSQKDEDTEANNNGSLDSVPAGEMSVFPNNVSGLSSILEVNSLTKKSSLGSVFRHGAGISVVFASVKTLFIF